MRLIGLINRAGYLAALSFGFALYGGSVYAAETITISHRSAEGNSYNSLYTREEILNGRENSNTGVVQGLLEVIKADVENGSTQYPFPSGTTLDNIKVMSIENGLGIEVGVRFPDEFIKNQQFNFENLEQIHDTFDSALSPFGVTSFNITFFSPKSGRWVTGENLIVGDVPKAIVSPMPDSEYQAKSEASRAAIPTVPPHGTSGALNGKSVVLNQSHGWYFNGSRWTIERSKIWESLEDFESPEFVNLFVIPALMNAGAIVKPVREPDHNPESAVVDNAESAPGFAKSGNWSKSSEVGFRKLNSYSGVNQSDNPFGEANSTDIVETVTGTPTASATFLFDVPKDGYYNTYIAYSAGANRTSDAHYRVNHSGGSTDLRIDQKKNGGTWILVGKFYYEANGSAEQRSVQVFNDSQTAGELVSIDAARIGGGRGIIRRYSSATSGFPRWQDSANHYLPYTGMMNSNLWYTNTSVLDNDVAKVNRARFSQWEQVRNNDGLNTVYIAWHTNAHQGGCVNGTDTDGASTSIGAKGLETWRTFASNPNNPSEIATPGSISLATAMHSSILNSVRRFYNPNFVDRNVKESANYPEVTRANLGDVSGILIEGLFHDYSSDMNMYKDPKFRMVVARAITQGVITHFGGTVFPPEPPENLSVRNIGNNQVRLDWSAGPVRNGTTQPYGSAATGYRIFKSSNGYGFDNGVDVGSVTNYTITLEPGESACFRVVAVNTAGISFPTETLGARTPNAANNPTVLVVNGYDRFDRTLGIITSAPGIAGCANSNPDTWRSMDYNRFNTLNYVVRHGKSIAASDFPFDSVSRTAFANAAFNLSSYSIIDWIGGQQSETDAGDNKNDEAFTTAERTKLQTYLEAGKRLLISNSRLGWDFGRVDQADAAKKTFLSNVLKTGYTAENAGVTKATATGGIFSGISEINFAGEADGAYDVREPGVIVPQGGASAALVYQDGAYTGNAAAVQYSGTIGNGTANAKLVNLSFGFEAIQTEAQRNAVMQRVLFFFTGAEVQDWSVYE